MQGLRYLKAKIKSPKYNEISHLSSTEAGAKVMRTKVTVTSTLAQSGSSLPNWVGWFPIRGHHAVHFTIKQVNSAPAR